MASRLPLAFALRLAGVRFMSGEYGSGAGKGGGAGGAVREAGGAFGKMEAAHEEMYFKKLEQEQLKKFREHLEEEEDYHKERIDELQEAEQLQRIREHLEEGLDHHVKMLDVHQKAIDRHKKRIEKLHHQEKDLKKKE